MQCKNKLKQIGLGVANHVSTTNRFPTGGWGWYWVGDPDQGFGRDQPGTWTYNILSYVEQEALRQLGAYQSDPTIKAAELTQLTETPLAVFVCPSRRRVAASAPTAHPLAVAVFSS
jgi:hypothetical protein